MISHRVRAHRIATIVTVGVVAFASACVAPPPAGAPSPPPSGPSTPTTTPPWVSEMLGNLNSQRAAQGAGPLSLCGTLMSAAQAHTEDQASHATMSHTGSNGSTMSQRAQAAGYAGWTSLGENVAYGYGDVSSVMDAWMNSPGHRANILNGGYTDVGLGLATSAGGAPYWTQDFGSSGNC